MAYPEVDPDHGPGSEVFQKTHPVRKAEALLEPSVSVENRQLRIEQQLERYAAERPLAKT